MFKLSAISLLLAVSLCSSSAYVVAPRQQLQKIVLTNDDGWAEANIRAEYYALKHAGYQVVLSAPAVDKSGTGSSSGNPQPLSRPCQYTSCPSGSPGIGFNSSEPLLNYVNAFPVDAARYGIQTLAPKFLGSRPDFVFSGVNVGSNLGFITRFSGTVGAAAEAALQGIPSVAFSGDSSDHVSYTTLETRPNAASSIAAHVYTSLSLKFIEVLLDNATPFLPPSTSLNVNYPSTSKCSEGDIKFILTRLRANNNAKDIRICGSERLPDESSAFRKGCYATVSVFDAKNKGDVSADIQKQVYDRIKPILSCLP